MFENFSEEELAEIFELRPTSQKVSEVINVAEINQGLKHLQEHAFVAYWHGRMNSIKCITDEGLENILSHRGLSNVVDGVLGELATRNMLSESQCQRIKKLLPKEEWAFQQVSARLIVKDIQRGSLEIQSLNTIIWELIELKTTWAIVEILKYCPDMVLQELKKIITEKKILTRSNRSYILQEIEKLHRLKK